MLNWLSNKLKDLNQQLEQKIQHSPLKTPQIHLPDTIKLDLNQLIGDNFNSIDFLNQIKRRFNVIHRARCCPEHLNEARNFLSDGLFNQLRRQLQINSYFDIKRPFIPLDIRSIRIVGYERDPYYDTLHVGIAASKPQSTKIVIQEIFSFCRKPGVTNAEKDDNQCPNCGYGLELSSDLVKCPSCQALINSGHYSWVLREISHALKWRAPSKRMIPGLTHLQNIDPTFCIQNSEDKMRSYFWQLQETLLTGDDSAIGTIGLASFCQDFLRFRSAGVHTTQNKLFCDVRVNTVELVFAETEGNYITLTFAIGWDGVLAIRNTRSRISYDNKRSSKRQCFTLQRQVSAIPKMDCGLSSLSCINCGGPLSYSKKGYCKYCKTELNNPDIDWVLTGMPNYYDISRNIKQKRVEMKSRRISSTSIPLTMINDKVGLLAGLVGMAAADGVISSEEYHLLKQYSQKIGITEEVLAGIIDDANNKQLEVPIPRSNEEARTWMKALVDLTLADSLISVYEEDFLADFGHYFNFTKLDTNSLIKQEKSQRFHQN